MRGPRATCGALAVFVLAALASAQREGPGPVVGKPGSDMPLAGDVRMADAPAHQDNHGGNNQVLLALAGSSGPGFGAVWRDQRDGMIGLYLARLDARGLRIEPERPFHVPHTGRRREPALALHADHSGAIVWISDVLNEPIPWLRAFDARGRVHENEVALLTLPDELASSRARETGVRQPSIAPRHPAGWFVAWTASGKIHLSELDAQGVMLGAPEPLEVRGPSVEPGIALASSGRSTICVWRAGSGSWSLDCARTRAPPASLGPGTLARLVPDPNGGFWALFEESGHALLRHLSSEGRPDREELQPIDASVAFVDLAARAKDLVLLAEHALPDAPARTAGAVPGERGEAAPELLRLHVLDRSGRARGAPVAFLPAETRAASQPRIAANGSGYLVAWTESRELNDPDVFARTYDPSSAPASAAQDLGPLQRLNSDVASADQTGPTVASAGNRALIAWQDKRDGIPQVYARRLGTKAFEGGEIRLPAAVAGAGAAARGEAFEPCERTGVAMRENGDFLVSWRQRREPRGVLRAQLFRADGAPIAVPLTIEEAPLSVSPAHAWVALPGDRGYLLLYARGEDGGLWTRRVSTAGEFAGDVQPVSTSRDLGLANPALALLDNERAIAAWDARATREGARWTLRGRFVDLDGVGLGDELSFEASPRGDDWDPSLAPAARNGFVIAWTSGSPDDRSRDVVARLHDSRGKASGPLLGISHQLGEQDYSKITRLSDGSLAVVWEDDVSSYDQTFVRRIFPSGRELGPIHRIHELETKVVEDRAAPIVAAVGDGLVLAWGDRRRSRGWDVFVRLLGPKFDAPAKR